MSVMEMASPKSRCARPRSPYASGSGPFSLVSFNISPVSIDMCAILSRGTTVPMYDNGLENRAALTSGCFNAYFASRLREHEV